MECKIQVLGYRTGRNAETGKEYIWQQHYADCTTVETLFANLDTIIEKSIPEKERYNIHYTTANCLTPNKEAGIRYREFGYQDIIPFDLDGINLKHVTKYIDIVHSVLNYDPEKTGIFCSGNGLHFIIATTHRVNNVAELNKLKPYYSQLCSEISLRIYNEGLTGNADPVRWAESATMRLPNTQNIKEGKEPTWSSVIKGNVAYQDFDMTAKAILMESVEPEQTTYSVDTPAVLDGCDFLKHCLSNPNSITEPQWYCMIGTLAFIPEVGRELCHTYSSGYKNYDADATDAKVTQAENFGRPRTCASIEQVWNGCSGCPNYRKCKTPLQIKSESFITTKDTGFHNIVKDEMGFPKKYMPNYDDLQKYFSQQFSYIVEDESATVLVYQDGYWKEYSELNIRCFATANFQPIANNNMRNEFLGLVMSRNVVSQEELYNSTHSRINFKNGVLDLNTNELLPHDKKYGFRYKLPYDYNPHAHCPTFDKFMKEITVNREDLEQMLLEFMGYSLSGKPASWGSKALWLVGEGSNGKSTLLTCIADLVGSNCVSSVPLESFNDPNSISQMEHSLFNVVEEVSFGALLKVQERFKAIVTGGLCEVKKLYKDRRSTRINSKLIFACNKLPPTSDHSKGVTRRLLIAPLDAYFSYAKEDRDMNAKLRDEMSGIYNRVIKAYKELVANEGKFTIADASKKALDEYMKESDVIAQWIEDNIEYIEDDVFLYVTHEELMEDFQRWRIQNNYSKVDFPMHALTRRFRQHFGIIDAEVRKINGKPKRGYGGVRLLNKSVTDPAM